MPSGSDHEPVLAEEPLSADEQMRAATEKLRDLAWSVGPLTAGTADEEPPVEQTPDGVSLL